MPSAAPLTHHEILALAEPFSRAGRRVDLAASDRAARCIAFRPVDHPARASEMPALRETLTLSQLDWGAWRLLRTLAVLDPAGRDGLAAKAPAALLEAVGDAPGELLARVQAVSFALQVQAGPGWTIALEQSVQAPGSRQARVNAAGEGPADLVLQRGHVRVDGLTVTMDVPRLRGISAELALAPDAPMPLPDDLFEVLGRGWGRIEKRAAGLCAPLRLRGRGRSRYRDAELKLRRIGSHLAQTLAETPAQWQRRLSRERWRVVLRRTEPLLVCAALLAGVALVPWPLIGDDSLVRMMILSMPPLLMAGFFCLRELPRLELPRPPRPIAAERWIQETRP